MQITSAAMDWIVTKIAIRIATRIVIRIATRIVIRIVTMIVTRIITRIVTRIMTVMMMMIMMMMTIVGGGIERFVGFAIRGGRTMIAGKFGEFGELAFSFALEDCDKHQFIKRSFISQVL